MNSDSVAAGTDTAEAPKAETKTTVPWSTAKKVRVFTPFILLVQAVLLAAALPEWMCLPTVCMFVWFLQIISATIQFIFKEDAWEAVGDQLPSGLIAIVAVIVLSVCLYFSHDIAQWCSLGIRDVVMATPHALKETAVAIWNFVINFFRHAFFGSPALAEAAG